jgi:uncharacterized protein YkwD
MRRQAQLLFTLLITTALVAIPSCTSQTGDAPIVSSGTPSSVPIRKLVFRINSTRLGKFIHDRVNRERLKHGLPTFRWDDALVRIAVAHSKDMARRNYFSHTSPEGQGYSYRYRKNNYACGITVNGVTRTGAENIFQFSLNGLASDAVEERKNERHVWETIAASTMQGWMASPEDRKNILSPHWQREAIGIFIGSDHTIYITVNFC